MNRNIFKYFMSIFYVIKCFSLHLYVNTNICILNNWWITICMYFATIKILNIQIKMDIHINFSYKCLVLIYFVMKQES